MNWLATLSRIPETMLDLLYPAKCIGCGREGTFICSSCIDQLPALKAPYCRKCGLPLYTEVACPKCRRYSLRIDGIRSVYLYQGMARDAVRALKYNGIRAIAMPLAGLIADYLKINPLPADMLVPVPMHARRLRQRGYNQSDLLTRQLGKIVELPVWERSLVRTLNTPSQVSLKAQARRRNVSGAFRWQGAGLTGWRVLLIDDVCTTGATLNACATALTKAGAASVWGLTFSRE